MIKTLVLSLLLFLIVTGCSPKYIDYFQYHEIASQAGRYCANECLSVKQECQTSLQTQYELCQIRESANYQSCLNSQLFWVNPKTNVYECYQNCFCLQGSCNAPDFSGCERNNVDCYLNCGGKVTVTTKCVQNCDEASPPATRVLAREGADDMKRVGVRKVSNNEKKNVNTQVGTTSNAQQQLEQLNKEILEKTSGK